MTQSQPTVGKIMDRPGLQAERTRLSWTRVSLAFFVNGVLLLTQVGGIIKPLPLYELMVCIALALALSTSVIGYRRKTTLSMRPLPNNLAATWPLLGLGVGTFIFGIAILAIMLTHPLR